jgi:predicted esterase
MKRIGFRLGLAALLFCLGGIASANTDMRQWTGNDGRFSAVLVKFDLETGMAFFKSEDGREFEMNEKQLSLTDQAWLREWTFIEDELKRKLEKLGGETEHHVTEGKYPTDLFIYHPPGVENAAARPMLILFSPTGRAQRNLLHYAEAAAELKIVLVACGQFTNTTVQKESDEMLERFREILPLMEKHVPHDPKRVMMGGSSGGAYRAFVYTVAFKRPWFGVYSNGGWLGPEDVRKRDYPPLRVAIVNGNNDFAANSVVEEESKILLDRGCRIAVFSFEGAHQVAPPEHTTDALRWMLTGE